MPEGWVGTYEYLSYALPCYKSSDAMAEASPQVSA